MTSPSDTQSKFTAVDFNPFAEGELLSIVPATESQKEIWASVQMGTEANCAYNESQNLRFRGNLNVDILQSALQALVQRHEALRTTFSPDGTTLCITGSLHIEIPIVDLSRLDQAVQDAEVIRLRQGAVEESFNVEFGPLFRAQIIKLNPQEHLAILTAHHIICDGWSWAVMMTDLGTLYSALKHGFAPELEEPEPFSEYAIALESAEGDEEATETVDYWLQQFAQSVPVLDFPTDRPRPPLRTFNSAREDWELTPELVTRLKRLGTSLGCSFMTTLLSGFEVFLHRLTGQNDVIVGIPAAGQAASGCYNLVGHCVNTLPLRTQVQPHQAFSQYLQARKSTVLDAYDHQQFTFGRLVQKLAIPRDPSRIPLIPIAFNIDQGLEAEKLPFDGLEVEFFSNPRSYENFELFINATELKGKVTLECQYNTNLFDADTIRRRMSEFQTLLEAIVTNPDQSIATLPLLTDAERHQLLVEWNNIQTDYPNDQSIHQLFEAQVQRTPDAIAVIHEGQQLSYRELNERANQLAYYLQSLGVGAETLVGICVERSFEMMIGLLGILKAGGTYVPLDIGYPAERLAFMLEDAQVSVLLTQSQFLEQFSSCSTQVICFDTHTELLAQQHREDPISCVTADSLAYVMYTSGSTGKPKGVSVRHRGVVRLVQNTDYARISAEDVFLQLAPIAFDAATFEIWGALLNGARLVLFPYSKPTLAQIGQIIAQHQITILWLTAGLFHLMVDERIDDLRQVRQLLAGGDVLSVPHVKKVVEQLTDCTLINGYGPTENTTFTCCYSITSLEQIGQSIPIGRPIANTQVYILDEHRQPVPLGVPGELYVGGDGVARGYFNRPELTQERFIPNPFSSEVDDCLYKTGDRVRYLPDGNIEFLGRIDNQVKVRGFRIELGEIETNLVQHPAVKEAVVIVREDVPGEKALVGYFSPSSGKAEESSDLITEVRQFLKARLPDFMVPTSFMALDVMPLTPNGKVDRKALPKPDTSKQLAASYVAPSSDLERQIADIWAQVLNLNRVGIHDNFFELGGHSLLAIQIVSRLRQALQVEILLPHLFEVPTVADLARRIELLRWAAQGAQSSQIATEDVYEEGEL